MLAVLGLCVRSFGLGAVVRVYLLPQMVANFYLCAITFMQHTHPDVPHCSPWTQGAADPVRGPRAPCWRPASGASQQPRLGPLQARGFPHVLPPRQAL